MFVPETRIPSLFEVDEPPPVSTFNVQGSSEYILVVDHAGRRIPRGLNDLGVAQSELSRHIAWDIGALETARRVAAILDAAVIAQNYSRLVIDCNRDPAVASSIPSMAEYTPIPGNETLTPGQRDQRRVAIFEPYHRCIRELIDERLAAGRRPMLVAQHSMTDCFKGTRRAMHAAVLYNRDGQLARAVLRSLRRESSILVAENEPYFLSDATDYTVPHHGESRGLPHVEIEIRQDLIADERGQAQWAERIAHALKDAQAELGRENP